MKSRDVNLHDDFAAVCKIIDAGAGVGAGAPRAELMLMMLACPPKPSIVSIGVVGQGNAKGTICSLEKVRGEGGRRWLIQAIAVADNWEDLSTNPRYTSAFVEGLLHGSCIWGESSAGALIHRDSS